VYNGAMACVVWQHIGYSRRTHTTGALTGGSGWRLLCTTPEHSRVCTGTAPGLRQGTHTVLKWYSTVLRYPAEHGRLRRMLVAVSVGHSGQCTALWGTPRVGFVRHGTVGERHRTEGDLACDARRILDGYSRAECSARRSVPVRQHCPVWSQ
jgi:hypothetical protein